MGEYWASEICAIFFGVHIVFQKLDNKTNFLFCIANGRNIEFEIFLTIAYPG